MSGEEPSELESGTIDVVLILEIAEEGEVLVRSVDDRGMRLVRLSIDERSKGRAGGDVNIQSVFEISDNNCVSTSGIQHLGGIDHDGRFEGEGLGAFINFDPVRNSNCLSDSWTGTVGDWVGRAEIEEQCW